MTFLDLPDDWPDHPVTHPSRVGDVLDLVVPEAARPSGALAFLVLDEEDRLVMPVVIDETGTAPEHERSDMLRPLLTTLGQCAGAGGSLLAGIARPGGLSVTHDDATWAEAIATAAKGVIRVAGIHVLAADGCRPVPRVMAA
jgi:hypothetical protein